jgi:hypothetical protein
MSDPADIQLKRHYFFTQAEWANLDYPVVTSAFSVGLVVWAILPPVGIRLLSQRAARRTRELPRNRPAASGDQTYAHDSISLDS